MKLLSEQKRN